MLATRMTETTSLLERSAGGAARIDTARGVLRNVKVLGRRSRNGRRYTPAALRAALPLYEGARVNINHRRPADVREAPLADRFGVLRRVRLASEGIFADLHYLTRHPLADMVVEAAQRMPEALGLSHDAAGRTVVRDGVEFVEEITRVFSVDLVSDPASTLGLFESHASSNYDRALGGRRLAEAVRSDSSFARTRSVL